MMWRLSDVHATEEGLPVLATTRALAPETSTSWMKSAALVSLLTAAVVRPSGDQRGLASPALATNRTSRTLPPSASATPMTDPDRSPVSHRVKTIWRPSGDQSPPEALSTSLRGSPPGSGTRYSAELPPVVRTKRSLEPSGEKRG